MNARRFSRWIGSSTCLVAMLAACWAWGQTAAPRPGEKYDGFEVPDPKDFAHAGTLNCQGCHNEYRPEQNPLYKVTKSSEFVRLFENRIWGVHDLHSRAFLNLGTRPDDLGQRMQAALRIGRNDPTYDVRKDVKCLACHLTDQSPQVPVKDKTWKSFMAAEGDEAAAFESASIEGVGCEMCHGYASKWTEPHKTARVKGGKGTVPWREWSPEVKSAFGLVNLRDPAVAAKKCASCHIGNEDEGRFVTHEMYAAGHPPLPPVDLLAYAREQPRHWGLPGEMPYLRELAKTNPDKAWELFRYRSEESENGEVYAARRLAVGAVGVMKASLELLAQEARESEKTGGLDFAAFDCYACHHDLKYPSARQSRGYDGPPGRPLFRPASFALARLIIEQAGEMPEGAKLKPLAAKINAGMKDLAGAFGERTLGNPPSVSKAATALVGLTDQAIADLEKVRFTRDESRRLLKAITAAGASTTKPVADPEVAQLYVWAVHSLYDALNVDGKNAPAELAGLISELDKVVVSRLRPNLASPAPPAPADTDYDDLKKTSLVPVSDRVKDRMQRLNGFDPQQFQQLFQQVDRACASWK